MADISMKKKFSQYETYIFDLDGTLYFQKKLRFIMATRLAGYYACHFWRLKELLVVKKFRQVRDNWEQISEKCECNDGMLDVDSRQYEYVAKCMSTSKDIVEQIVKRWIYDNPLDAVAASKDTELAGIIEKLRNNGKRVVIFSDYPTRQKLEALGIDVDGEYCSADVSIGELKPSPKGIDIILNDYNQQADGALMIGDRMEKDGESAVAAGIDYCILPRSKSKRDYSFFV